MLKNCGINLNFLKTSIVNNGRPGNATEVKSSFGEHSASASTSQQAHAPQRARERGMAEVLQAKLAESGGVQSTSQKASVPQHQGGPSVMGALLTRLGITKTHKWPLEKQFAISSDSDWIIKNVCKVHTTERKIPKENLFSIANLSRDSLARVDLTGRITLHGHGSTKDFAGMSPTMLAQKLVDAGLKEVGVLKFKSCDVGKERYLEKLKVALDLRDIKVGYISAPTGRYRESRININVAGRAFNLNPFCCIRLKTVESGFKIVPERFGLKTIKGNVDISFNGTRYDIPSSPSTSENGDK